MNTGTRAQVAATLIFGSRILLRLDHHLPLFLGGAVIHEYVALGDDVKG